MDPILGIVIAVAILAIIALVVVAIVRRRRRAALRERFGPEFEREAAARGSDRAAAEHLGGVADRRDRLDIRALETGARDHYTHRWEIVQTEFVDRPGPALDEADRLVTDVMRDRGYPVDDFEQRVELVAADHPQVVQHYRAALASRRQHHGGGVSDTENLRQAFVHYRALFVELVHDGHAGDQDRANGRVR